MIRNKIGLKNIKEERKLLYIHMLRKGMEKEGNEND